MTLIIQKPTGAKLNLRKTWQPMDADAAAYITSVETADGQALEEKVKIAIDNFVLGCKADGIWSAIKASCILAGARTLAGCLVPLVGTAPTNNNFVAGDYNRKTGLIGNGSSKYLNTNTAHNVASASNRHCAAYISAWTSASTVIATGNSTNADMIIVNPPSTRIEVRSCPSDGVSFNSANGSVPSFAGIARSNTSNFVSRFAQTNTTHTNTSGSTTATNYTVFALPTPTYYSNGRFAFYSIGESLDLAKLDARVTDLINAFGAAIP